MKNSCYINDGINFRYLFQLVKRITASLILNEGHTWWYQQKMNEKETFDVMAIRNYVEIIYTF